MKFPAVIFSIGMLVSATFTSCKKEDAVIGQSDLQQVLYGSDTAMKMDIYLPAGRDTANTKVIVFIHGGSWGGGDKTEFNDAINVMRSQLPGYALFNINYRLAFNGVNRHPAQINDVKSAIDFITGKAGEYRVNAGKICLLGFSAGAHLALLEAYKNNSNGKIKAVVDLFGPADLTDLYNNHPFPTEARPVLVNFLGTTPSANPALYQQASPINFITAQTVPTAIFHGGADFVVPISQSNALKAKLQANNVKVEMTVYPAEGHGWYGTNLSDTYSKAAQFIKENVR